MQRKVERVIAATHGGYAGSSIIELLETELLEATIEYLTLKDTAPTDNIWPNQGSETEYRRKCAAERGKVRGLAIACATWRNPYTADQSHVIKGVEREFARAARSHISKVDDAS